MTSGTARTLGQRFELREVVESRDFVTTWIASDLHTSEQVFLKVASGLNRDQQLRLAYEAELLSRLDTPHIVKLLAAGLDGEEYFVAVRSAGAQTLRQRIDLQPLTVTETLTVGVGMARALEAVHQLGLCHRDLKPENILLDEPITRAVVIDFGLASVTQPSGSPAYMAPERLGLIRSESDFRSDLYEAGLVLYETLAGTLPFSTDDIGEQLRERTARQLPSIRGARPDVHPVLEAIVFRLLEVDPDQRYQEASAVVHDLESLLCGETPVVGSTDVRFQLAPPALIGRKAQLDAFHRQLEATYSGQVRVLRVMGSSGSGKTRLLEEFARSALGMGARVLESRAQSQSVQLPFSHLESIFLKVGAELEQNPALREEVLPWGEAIALASPAFRRIFEPAQRTSSVPANLSRATARMLLKLPGTSVLLLDDCQWANDSVFEVVDACAGHSGSLLCVLAFRDDELPEGHPLFRYRESDFEQLPSLSQQETCRLVESMAGPLPAKVRDWIWEVSRGNPFMAESTLRGLLESGSLARVDDEWSVPNDFVETGHASRRAGLLLMERLRLLSDQHRSILAAAAVVGRRFVPELVAVVTGLPLNMVAEGLEEARKRHLLLPVPETLAFRFAHDKIREALLGQLSEESLRESHLALGEYLVLHDSSHPVETAYHLHRAGLYERAAPYALEAASAARAASVNELAARYYRIALEGIPLQNESRRLEVSVALADVLSDQGQYEEAGALYEMARSTYTDPVEKARMESRLSLIYSSTDAQACKRSVGRGLNLLGYALPSQPVLAALLEIVKCYRQQHAPPKAEGDPRRGEVLGQLFQALPAAALSQDLALQAWCVLKGVNLLERLPLSRHLGVLYGNLAAGCALGGLHRPAAHFADRAVKVQQELRDDFGLGQAWSRWVVPKLARGAFQEVVEQFPKTLRLLEPSGHAWELGATKTHSALALYYRGRFKAALAVGEETLREALMEGDQLQASAAILICTLSSQGRFPIPPDTPEFTEKIHKSYSCLALAIVELYGGRPEKALAHLIEAKAQGDIGVYTAGVRPWLLTALRQTVEALPSEGAHVASELLRLAKHELPRALSLGKTHAAGYAHALRESALLAARRGLRVRARKEFDRSLAVARRYQMDYEMAWTLVERGRIGLALGWEDAERDLGHGRSLLARIGAWLPGEKPEQKPVPVLSVVDRFSKVLDYGRRIAASLDEAEVRQLLVAAGLGLLRCQDCRVLEAAHLPHGEFSTDLVGEATRAGRTVLRDEGLPEDLSESLLLSGVRSALCAPVMVHGEVDCFLYVTHQLVGQLFGEEERRIGDYLASLAGAALENARNFRERQKATERFETLFRWTGVGTAVVAHDGQITDSNPFFEQMLGARTEGVLLDTIYHADRSLVAKAWKSLFEQGKPVRLEVRCLRASGELLWAQMTASRPPGESLAIVAFSDVSHRRLEQVAAFQESERRLLAAELHDGVSQPLAGLFFGLQTAAARAEGQQAADLHACVSQAQSILMEISQLMFDLRDPTAGDVDAVKAVLELCRSFASETGIEVDAKASGGEVKGLAGTFLFRLVQEALTNVRKHARASQVEVRLEADEREVHGRVSDNGQGFEPSELSQRTTRHFGLQGMRERAELLGGACHITPGQAGTRVEFRLPLV